MDTTTTAVFTAATTATHWTRTNLGPRTQINHAGYTWTVELPASGHGPARITSREGHGGTELLDITATSAQTIGIVEAAMSALRIPSGSPETGPEWLVEDFGNVIACHRTEDAAKAYVRELLVANRVDPQRLTVQWLCALCDELGECLDCEASQTREQVAYLLAEGCARVPTAYLIRPTA